MKRVFCLILLLLTLHCAASADALPLSDMTTSQLLELKNQIDAELLADHSVSEDAEARLRALADPVLSEAGLEPDPEWSDCAVVREWDLSVLTASCFLQNGIVSRPADIRIEAFLSESGDRLVCLAVGDDVLFDARGALNDPRLLAFLGLTVPPEFSEAPAAASDAEPGCAAYVCNTNTHKFHDPSCKSVPDILPDNRLDTTADRDELIASGYAPCGRCKP